jgi:CRISPR-associated protein Csd2
MTTSSPVSNRYDFMYLFDCKDGNPNGDPDMANTPRFDPETFQGLVTDVCLKRKVREYVFALKSQRDKIEPGYDVFVLQGHSLESRQRMPYDNLMELKDKAKGNKTDRGDIDRSRSWMCANFFDIRAFGAVMSTTDFNCGQVRGPIQITFARSIDRVMTSEHAITRVAYTTEEKQKSTSAQTEMGNKHTIAYGLYVAYGFVSPYFAQPPKGTGFNEDDLTVLWQALRNMFDLDHSASRGLMACRGLYIFKHDSLLGNAPAQDLFARIAVRKKDGIEAPRNFDDYRVTVDNAGLPAGVTIL